MDSHSHLPSSVSPQSDPAAAKIALHTQEHTAYLTFSNPHAKNAMTRAMYEELHRVCTELSANKQIKALVLRGAGGESFVAGSDIAQFKDFDSPAQGLRYERELSAYLTPLLELPIPTIAVIEGFAVGGGLAIACACDFRIAEPKARFGVPIARTLGNCLSAHSTALLLHHLGAALLRRMLLLGELIDAQHLLAQGFILQIEEKENLGRAAELLAERLTQLAPITQKVSKLTLLRLLQSQLPSCDDLVSACYASQDFRTGVSAFLEGKKPQWSGS